VHVAEDGLDLLGLAVFFDSSDPDLFSPDRTTELAVCAIRDDRRRTGVGGSLVAQALSLKTREGYRFCVADWRCANLQARGFWRSLGFLPVAHRLVRGVMVSAIQ
jgi:ribosomal protein S18 acetylase RimI-like enzyme